MESKTVKIDYGNLYITDFVGEEEKAVNLPIKMIPEMEEAAWQHIHGYLSIKIGDEKLYSLGFFGEDGVCFNDWIGTLIGVINCFSKSSQCRFLFCDGEQGNDAFEFCKDNDSVYISYVDREVYHSILGAEFFDGGRTNPEENADYTCDYKDFDASVRDFIERFKKNIFFELGEFAPVWWWQNTGTGGRCSHSL